jgi:hypothetical protein
MPLSDPCELVRGEPRSWYYEKKPGPEEKAGEDVELRDAIERGSYRGSPATATAGSRRPRSAKDGRSTARRCRGR